MTISSTTAPAVAGAEAGPDTSWLRTLYAELCDPESVVPGAVADQVRAELRRLPGPDVPAWDLTDDTQALAAWSGREAAGFERLWQELGPDDGVRDLVLRRAALNCAPLALISGAWLQWLSSMAEADDPLTLRVLKLYAGDVGAGHAHSSRGDAYLTLLRRLQLADNAVPASGLALDRRIHDDAFYLPAVLLLMSRRPEEFRPEILGADLCLRTTGLLPPLALVRAGVPGAAWNDLDPASARSAGDPPGRELVRAAVAGCLDGGDAQVRDRVAAGFRWAAAAVREWGAGLRAELEAARDPAAEMAALLRLRAREGAVYHHAVDLGGRSLADWLTQARTDPWPLLDVLSRSKLVRPGDPARSALATGLVGERGAMFRVFAPTDLETIRRWIRSLPGAKGGPEPEPTAPPAAAIVIRHPFPAPDPATGDDPDLRTAYALLQRRTVTPAVRRFALDYVHAWLGRSAHRIDSAGVPLPDAWTSQGLRPWLTTRHEEHAAEFERGTGDGVPSREQLIESSVQLAPLTMIDGAWLQGFTDYALASSSIGFSLFETYWDELGNGEARLNHPLIYRELVAQMGVELPPTGSLEFARWPGFADSSFELPVYWLSIGRFPRTFLPEVLGLNLAMELSGVGGSYRRARIALVEHGFSTRFVDIHNTIDNVATGHSAWAADAIDSFMSGIPATGDPGAREAAWRRIRHGYRSLNPPGDLRARLAAGRARRAGRRWPSGRPGHV
ncbi:iron-containing redox enzyme family protein [Symbioplanes lichenis]|uniref:iron-containing redox enzyme family protein n=1 Tax=Symbioplanes lichenis TaxID=1629072 RepID=UPI0027395B0C|nr:iron-containing redox enzyme family protein [Actinoplanes lichenis]